MNSHAQAANQKRSCSPIHLRPLQDPGHPKVWSLQTASPHGGCSPKIRDEGRDLPKRRTISSVASHDTQEDLSTTKTAVTASDRFSSGQTAVLKRICGLPSCRALQVSLTATEET
ncbi:hypothetical protein NHX12_033533 [Muraenolepis orangiensis]|uniref:Uncharacterized protein n=1 Tax=Muraenolepis orangiensis TaxID=630683 RepID=A0A9Q0II24_9TELE|nr:hypothetical protein NHX12_033533 [Muraenolepis orangiensis]